MGFVSPDLYWAVLKTAFLISISLQYRFTAISKKHFFQETETQIQILNTSSFEKKLSYVLQILVVHHVIITEVSDYINKKQFSYDCTVLWISYSHLWITEEIEKILFISWTTKSSVCFAWILCFLIVFHCKTTLRSKGKKKEKKSAFDFWIFSNLTIYSHAIHF